MNTKRAFANGLIFLGLAVLGVARLVNPHLAAWHDHQALAIGMACTLLLAVVWGMGSGSGVLRRVDCRVAWRLTPAKSTQLPKLTIGWRSGKRLR